MSNNSTSRIVNLIKQHEEEILTEWISQQLSNIKLRSTLMKEADLRDHSRRFLTSFIAGAQSVDFQNSLAPQWQEVREILTEISRSRARQGFTPSETAAFIFSLKRPLFHYLRQQASADAEMLGQDLWVLTDLLDQLGLFTTEIHQLSREDVIARQQQELLELSTPVVQLWQGILAMPLIGTLDSARTQIVMESLLQKIVDTGSAIAIIDITGVPTVDTLVAQHLLKTVAAARLMGADCIISGIRPQIAQTIVHLGVELTDVITKASLADAFKVALQRVNLSITKVSKAPLPARGE